uniref:nSTAND1 domain-containing NTPase n=1 Tax=Candidatus Electrothrix sp. TaxID=2170559 RepID=UPI0040562B9E
LAAHRQTPGLWPLNRHEHGEFIFLVPGHELNLPPAPDLTEKNNPYKGLSPYEKGDSELFFGRTDLVKKLKRRVAKLPFTVVLGASGTGKSSLVKAGLLPALEHGANKEKQSAEENDASQPSSWFILERVTEKDGKKKKEVMRPGANPLATLRSLLINDLPGVRPERKGGATPAGMIGQWRKKNPGLKLLLVIDQFEELITLCREEQARKDFIRELRQALDEHSKVLRIVLTLRSDFEAQISQNYLKECWRQNYRFVVPPMTQDELREVIEEPASLRVLYFEPRNLVDDLINEVVQTPGSLPLLSFTLSELYRRYVKRQKDVKQQDGNRALTKADYEKMGGIIGSLRSRIEQKYNELDVAQKKTLRRILLRMVAFEGGELTRRQAPEWEFTYPSVKETKEVKELLKGLTKNRLIVVDERNDAKGKAEPYYEASDSRFE